MENIEIRKELFEIIKNYMDENVSEQDIKRLAEILLYHTPYKNRVVFPVTQDELKIEVKSLTNSNLSANLDQFDNTITYNFHYSIKQLFKLLKSSGHEYTHFLQFKYLKAMLKESNAKFSKRTQSVLNSLQSIRDSQKLSDFIDYFGKQKSIFETIFDLCFNKRAIINDYAYYQVPYEENARNCGFQFAKEILACMKNDPLCDEKTMEFLDMQQKSLQIDWEKEIENRRSVVYSKARKKMIETVKKAGNMKLADLDKIEDVEILSKTFICLLPKMRQQKLDKISYAKALLKYGFGLLDLASQEYLQGIDQTQIVLDYILNDEKKDFLLNIMFGRINFADADGKIEILNPEAIHYICKIWLYQKKFVLILSVLECCIELRDEKKYSNCFPAKCLEKERLDNIEKAIYDDQEFVNEVESLYAKIASQQSLNGYIKLITEEGLELSSIANLHKLIGERNSTIGDVSYVKRFADFLTQIEIEVISQKDND